jgi:hypothetical protein
VFFVTSCRVSDDIGVPLKRLQLLSERNISSFVPRLSVNKGMLPVRLKLTGTDDLPGSAAIQVSSSFRTAYSQAGADQSQWNISNFTTRSPLEVLHLWYLLPAITKSSALGAEQSLFPVARLHTPQHDSVLICCC